MAEAGKVCPCCSGSGRHWSNKQQQYLACTAVCTELCPEGCQGGMVPNCSHGGYTCDTIGG